MTYLNYLVTGLIVCSIACNHEANPKRNIEAVAFSESVRDVPNLSFTVKIIEANNLPSGTHGDNTETKLIFSINDVVIDEYLEFGDVMIEKDEDGNVHAFFASDISQKTISTEIVNSNKILVKNLLFFDGEERELWVREYMKVNGAWKFVKCEGEC